MIWSGKLGQIIGLLVNTPITITCARSAPKRPRSADHIAARRARRTMNQIRSLDWKPLAWDNIYTFFLWQFQLKPGTLAEWLARLTRKSAGIARLGLIPSEGIKGFCFISVFRHQIRSVCHSLVHLQWSDQITKFPDHLDHDARY